MSDVYNCSIKSFTISLISNETEFSAPIGFLFKVKLPNDTGQLISANTPFFKLISIEK